MCEMSGANEHMGQYHHIVSMDANEYLQPHNLGCGLKAWEQTTGGIPAALTLLLAANPGNMPADIGHHPMTGRWAGHRLLAAGDYAEKDDLKKFQGPPLDRIYGLCGDEPKLEDFRDRVTWKAPGSSSSYGKSYRHLAGPGAKRCVETAKSQYAAAVRRMRKITANGKYEFFRDLSGSLKGAVEYALSVRYCGDGWQAEIPVKPYAERGPDEHLHYVLPNRLSKPRTEEDRHELAYLGRMLGLWGWADGGPPTPKTVAAMAPDGSRWPFDRPPADLSWHNAIDADQDLGQERVFANLDRREYFTPRAFGEVPTTLGIMRAAGGRDARHCIDMMISDTGVQRDLKMGDSEFSSAAALFVMLLHPEVRGGGDIGPEQFPEIGCWRNCRLVLTSERASAELPSTKEAMTGFTDISGKIFAASAKVAEAA